jgi:hypothetical protein
MKFYEKNTAVQIDIRIIFSNYNKKLNINLNKIEVLELIDFIVFI